MNEGREGHLDLIKGLSEWALTTGRFYQSEQTGYVHLYSNENEQKAQTIPLIENVLFVYALFRSRMVEQVQEAKELLKKLLIFQNKQGDDTSGNFPVYLHEYPTCRDPALALQLLAPFFWILKEFGHILGAKLKSSLELAALNALKHSLKATQEKSFSYALSVRLASAQVSFGILFNDLNWKIEGEKYLHQLSENQLEGWQTTKQIGDILVGLQMVYPSLPNSPWVKLWTNLNATWHSHLACYIGPHLREWQEGLEPQVNLYDLFGGYFARQFSKRSEILNPQHLHGILIHPQKESFEISPPFFAVEGVLNSIHNKNLSFNDSIYFKRERWQIEGSRRWAFTLLNKKSPIQPTVDKTHTSFRYVWGNLDFLHSFVCQGGNAEKIEYEKTKTGFTLFFDLKDLPQDNDLSSKKEIEFFVDFHPSLQFHVNNQPSSTFELGNVLEMKFGENLIAISVEKIEGEGDFLGHIMRGNRYSQLDLKGENRHKSYDWTIFIRSIRRQGHCRLKVSLDLL